MGSGADSRESLRLSRDKADHATALSCHDAYGRLRQRHVVFTAIPLR